MKIVLIIPIDGHMSEKTEDPGGLSISASLKEDKQDVLVFQKREENIPWNSILAFQPDMVAFCVYYPSRELVYKLAVNFKKRIPNILVCAGGIEVTISSKEIMEECPSIDFLVKGEGETTMIELIRKIEENQHFDCVKGLLYRDGNQIVENDDREMHADLNLLPWVDRTVLEDNKIHNAYISTSRGCTSACTFCLTPSTYKRKWRGREVKDVVDEIEHIYRVHKINCFHFSDASLEDPDDHCERLNILLDEILKRKLPICYSAEIRAEFHKKATDELMKKFKESGLFGVFIGIESYNESDFKILNKRGILQDNDLVLQLFLSHEIDVQIGFINLTPYTSFNGMQSNIEFLNRYQYLPDLKYIWNRAMPYKKTVLHQMIKRDQLFEDEKRMEYRFVDARIDLFYNLLKRYMESQSPMEKNALNDISLFFSTWNNYYLQMKKCYLMQFGHLEKFLQATEQYQGTFNELRTLINGTNYAFLTDLMQAVESDSLDEDFFAATKNNHLPTDILLEFQRRINHCILRLYKQIYRLDITYASDFMQRIKLDDNMVSESVSQRGLDPILASI